MKFTNPGARKKWLQPRNWQLMSQGHCLGCSPSNSLQPKVESGATHPSWRYRVLQKTAIHLKPQRYLAYPRNPQLQCCDRKCRALSTEMAVFFEGRRAQNSEDNIELGDGGGHDLYGVVLHGMAVFLKNRVCIYLYLYIYIYIYNW